MRPEAPFRPEAPAPTPLLGVQDLLEVRDLRVAYGPVEALRGVSLSVGAGEVVALVGANGAGKTTLLNAVSGVLRPRAGSVRWCGADVSGLAVEALVRRGLAHCPEGRRIFPGLSVLDNLRVGGAIHPRGPEGEEDLERVLALFPRLRERARQSGWSLSGGEQQMLAIGRALMGRPRLLMLDEPSLGLAPRVVDTVFDALIDLNRRAGLALLIVEQNAAMALEVSSRAVVLETGAVTLEGPSAALADDPRVRAAYLGG